MNLNFDVLIIGTGVAGLSSAVKLAESGLNIAIVTRQILPTPKAELYMRKVQKNHSCKIF